MMVKDSARWRMAWKRALKFAKGGQKPPLIFQAPRARSHLVPEAKEKVWRI